MRGRVWAGREDWVWHVRLQYTVGRGPVTTKEGRIGHGAEKCSDSRAKRLEMRCVSTVMAIQDGTAESDADRRPERACGPDVQLMGDRVNFWGRWG